MSPRASLAASVLALLFALAIGSPAGAKSVCLTKHAEQQVVTYPMAAGSTLHLSFRHSIYGSDVEEQFQVTPGGFRAIKLRYAEPRLVEFYGHESATTEDGWWVVHNPGRVFPSLDLRVSREASIRINFLDQNISLTNDIAIDGRVRLSVRACPRDSNG
jgi:hypothetical protein